MKNHVLVRLVSSSESEAEASNDVRVTYYKPTIEIIEADMPLVEAEKALAKIESEVKFYKDVLEEFYEISRKSKTRMAGEIKQREFIENLMKSDNPLIKVLNPYAYRAIETIKSRLDSITGEYLIMPCIYKQL